MNILITGSTGFIGQELVRKLADSGNKLFLLVRPQSKSKAEKLFSSFKNVQIIEGDITETDLILNTSDALLTQKVDTFVHLAALYDLKAEYTKSYLQNVIGTQNVLNFLEKLPNLKHFHYFSTYAVNPIEEGVISENYLETDDHSFPDSYSATKNHAEHLVRRKKGNFKTIIHRPGIVVGNSTNGEFEKIDGPYLIWDLFYKALKLIKMKIKVPFLVLPVNAKANLPVITIDTLIEWSSEIINNPPQEDRSYHLISPQRIPVLDFLEKSLSYLGLQTRVFPAPGMKLLTGVLKSFKFPAELIFYANQNSIYETTTLFKDYPHLKYPLYQNYIEVLINGYLRKINERDH